MELPWGLSWWDVYLVGFLGCLLSATMGTALSATSEDKKFLSSMRAAAEGLPFPDRVITVVMALGMLMGALLIAVLWPLMLLSRAVVWVKRKKV